MRTATKLSAYGLALAVIAGGAWAIGTTVGPLDTKPAAEEHSMGEQTHAEGDLPGLAVSANGYRLELDQNQLPTGISERFTFRVLGPSGSAVTGFDVEHDKRLHLVLVRRDGFGYQHLHPELAADGTWSIPLTLPAAGSYRVFTDFKASGGMKTVLGADIQAPGEFQPRLPDRPLRTATVDGYQVRLAGELIPGKASPVSATVTRNGAPVDLEPYLGAAGHLVALRAADLGYLHVHPLGEPGDGATAIRFAVEVPTPGRYRLFLDFKHAGTVRTAEFTVDTGQEAHS